MKKSILTFATTVAVFGVGVATTQTAAHASSKTISVYQFKKTGKHVKLTSATNKSTSKHLTKGNAITYNGTKYYYSTQVKGYVTASAFKYAKGSTSQDAMLKKQSQKLKAQIAKANQDSKNSHDSGVAPINWQHDDIRNGFDYTVGQMTDWNQWLPVFKARELELVNQARSEVGVAPVTEDDKLTQVAQDTAKDDTYYFDNYWNTFDGHHNFNGQQLSGLNAVKDGLFQSYAELNENAACHYGGLSMSPTDAAEIEYNGYYAEKSSHGGHYQNMVDPSVTKIGIGASLGDKTYDDGDKNMAFVQDFM
ncbi:CAP domain-containing protein [Lactobacillus sp. Sy-1]|uniref:CAP domain-containing protein n=1 Tax=Lactobacillus sp. Sy-1 TaxID=2109645 RepID=UPI001C5A7034|nr:CAP domain-containing protein [Lactobacillus sp. Sy-1]MBW1606096.1 CAP domain-containing protein [Lactobacillus sp. Sy-1]